MLQLWNTHTRQLTANLSRADQAKYLPAGAVELLIKFMLYIKYESHVFTKKLTSIKLN